MLPMYLDWEKIKDGLIWFDEQNNCIWNCLFNISRDANIVDPDQTASTGAVWSGFTLFIYEASSSLVDDKNIHFVIMRFKS